MLIKVEHVSKIFEGTVKETLQDINLEIQEGEFICLVGPSGCGKSTLLNLIAGLDEATAGQIYFDGKQVTGAGPERAVMFQESALFPWLTVGENVKFGMKMAGVPEKEQNEKMKKYLEMVNLSDFESYYPKEISGGMKQRTALARALAMDSRMLLMDEPFSALDKQTINMLRSELETIWGKTGKTILFVTHSVEEAVYFADRVVILSDNPGEIKEIIPIDLPRPRKIEDEDFIHIRGTILKKVRREVEKIAETEHDRK